MKIISIIIIKYILQFFFRDNDGAEYLYLNFSVDTEDSFGNPKTVELKPNGESIDVTDANKNEYIE